MTHQDYSPTELMICVAARLMQDGMTAFIGTGIPMLAASLAQKMHAPNLIPIFEFGGTGAILEDLPLAVARHVRSIGRWPHRASATSWKRHSGDSWITASLAVPRSTCMET
jgi:hypothetical protein